MKNKKYRLGLSILAGGLSFVGAANATDLMVNGSFESPSLYDDSNQPQAGGAGWQYFGQYNYSAAYYAGPAVPADENPGDNYSWKQSLAFSDWSHFDTPNSPSYMFSFAFLYAAQQRVDLTTVVSAGDIDAGLGSYTFSAWLASYTGNQEQPYVYLQFFSNATGEPASADFISTPAVFDRCRPDLAVQYADGTSDFPIDLTDDHNWIKYVATGTIPAGARQAKVFITRSPNSGLDGSPDTYVDLVKLDVTGATAVAPSITSSPTNQTAAVGNSVTFSVTTGGTPPTYQWRHSGTNLPSGTSASLVLPVVHLTDAGNYVVVVSNSAGSVTSSPPATLAVINPPVVVTGQWDFLSNNLAASYGADLQYHDSGVQGTTAFGTTASFGIPNLSGVPTPVMHFTPPAAQWGGYKMFHQAAPNGGGTNVNQYTLIYDIYYPAGSDGTWRSLWQTLVANTNDASLFVDTSDGIGISGVYNGSVSAGAWHRLAFAFDLTGTETGTATTPLITKFIDGVKVGNQTVGLDAGKDGRWSVGPYGLLFADNDGDVAEAYVSSVQFSNGRRPDAFIEALGGPSAFKIPGAIRADMSSGHVVIRWTGGVPLQSADSLTGTWTTVSGTAGQFSFTPTPLTTAKFYRPQIP